MEVYNCITDLERKKLQGQSVLAESIRQFGIEVMCIEIEDYMRNQIMEAREKQKMTNI